MRFAVYDIAVKSGAQRGGHPRGSAAEGDPVPAARHLLDREPLRLEPRGHLRYVAAAETKTVGELLRRDPAPIIRRRGILLLGEKRFQSGGGRQQHRCIADLKGRIERAAIVLRASLRMHLPGNGHRAAGIDRLVNPIRRGGDGQRGAKEYRGSSNCGMVHWRTPVGSSYRITTQRLIKRISIVHPSREPVCGAPLWSLARRHSPVAARPARRDAGRQFASPPANPPAYIRTASKSMDFP